LLEGATHIADFTGATFAVSAIVMTGVCGQRYAKAHVCGTIAALYAMPLGAGDSIHHKERSMNRPRSRAGLRLLALALALCAAVLVIVACAPAVPSVAPAASVASAPTQVSASTEAPAVQATQPAANPSSAAASAVGSDKQWSQDPAPSLTKNPAAANTRHYQGDPNAPVVIIEASDFQ
jgi:hypothetical protein